VKWLSETFQALDFPQGMQIMDEVAAENGQRKKEREGQLTSDQMFEAKLAEVCAPALSRPLFPSCLTARRRQFRELTSDDTMLWEYRQERDLFLDVRARCCARLPCAKQSTDGAPRTAVSRSATSGSPTTRPAPWLSARCTTPSGGTSTTASRAAPPTPSRERERQQCARRG
jgi:hypothetical protein